MTYICVDCGNIFEEDAVAEWYEDRGEFWGMPCRERMTGCPNCHGAYEEVKTCVCCHELYLKEELYEGHCERCQEEMED